MSIDKKTPHPPKRMNLLGRKRYSMDANALDVIDFSFDDCWRAISWLWFLLMALAVVVLQGRFKAGFDTLKKLFKTRKEV